MDGGRGRDQPQWLAGPIGRIEESEEGRNEGRKVEGKVKGQRLPK